MSEKLATQTFFYIFKGLKDPRKPKGRKYPLMDVIILALYGTLCGETDFTNISKYLKYREKELINKFNLAKGVPSHDVFSDVFRGIDSKDFVERFIMWGQLYILKTTGKHIAIDGKALRAAAEKSNGDRTPYIISAYLCGCGLSLAQVEVGEKKNEITEIPELLKLLDITGLYITIDAIGSQTKIMDLIKKMGGHFCLQLKKNHKEDFESVQIYFNDLEKNMPREFKKLDYYKSINKDHGRIDKREYRVLHDIEVIRQILNPKWKHVKCIGIAKLSRTIMNSGEESVEIHYHLMDTCMSAKEYGKMARDHWQIENGLHWILDNSFGEDRCTSRKDNAKSNVSLLHKIGFNMMKIPPELKDETTKGRFHRFKFDTDLFMELIYSTPKNEEAADCVA